MFAKKYIIAMVVCLLIALSFALPAKAQEPPPCTIWLMGDVNATISKAECPNIIIGDFYSYALTSGLVNASLQDFQLSFKFSGANYSLTVGSTEAAKFWSPIEDVVPENLGFICHNRDYISIAWWNYYIKSDQLAPGSYTFNAEFVIKHTLFDGMQACTDLSGNPVGHYMIWPGVLPSVSEVTITQ